MATGKLIKFEVPFDKEAILRQFDENAECIRSLINPDCENYIAQKRSELEAIIALQPCLEAMKSLKENNYRQISREAVLQQFDENARCVRDLIGPGCEKYLAKKRDKLDILISIKPFLEELKVVKEENAKLRQNLANSQEVLRKAIKYVNTVYRTYTGFSRFGKDAERILNEAEEETNEFFEDTFDMPSKYRDYTSIHPFETDPKNKDLLKIEDFDSKYVPREVENADFSITEEHDVLRKTTHWFDEFGFEVRREIRQTWHYYDSLHKNIPIDEVEPRLVITRKNGIITINDSSYFDTGAQILPTWDSRKKAIYLAPDGTMAEAIDAENSFHKEDILSQFDKNASFMETRKKFEHPGMKEKIAQRRAELEAAIVEQERTYPYRQEIKRVEKENEKLRSSLESCNTMIREIIDFAEEVGDSVPGTLFLSRPTLDFMSKAKKCLEHFPEEK